MEKTFWVALDFFFNFFPFFHVFQISLNFFFTFWFSQLFLTFSLFPQEINAKFIVAPFFKNPSHSYRKLAANREKYQQFVFDGIYNDNFSHTHTMQVKSSVHLLRTLSVPSNCSLENFEFFSVLSHFL